MDAPFSNCSATFSVFQANLLARSPGMLPSAASRQQPQAAIVHQQPPSPAPPAPTSTPAAAPAEDGRYECAERLRNLYGSTEAPGVCGRGLQDADVQNLDNRPTPARRRSVQSWLFLHRYWLTTFFFCIKIIDNNFKIKFPFALFLSRTQCTSILPITCPTSAFISQS